MLNPLLLESKLKIDVESFHVINQYNLRAVSNSRVLSSGIFFDVT